MFLFDIFVVGGVVIVSTAVVFVLAADASQAAASPHLTFDMFNKFFKFIDFNKEQTSSLKMI